MSDHLLTAAVEHRPRAGTGFVIATLFGSIGLAVAAVLWAAGASLWLVLGAYFGVPAAMLAGLFLATSSASPQAADLHRKRARRHV